MTRTKRLKPVVKHTDKKERQALKAVAFSQAELNTEKSRLAQLEDYKIEYVNKISGNNNICSAFEMQEFNRFLAQLNHTIEQQFEVTRLRKRELDRKRQSWQATQIDSKKIHKVIDNLEQRDKIRKARIEQKVMDEFSLFKFRNN